MERERLLEGSPVDGQRFCVDFRYAGSLFQERAGQCSQNLRRSIMRVMVLVKATEDSERNILPKRVDLEAMGRFNDELRNAGILRDCDGLKPSSYGKRIAFDGSSRTVIDGPFAQSRELVAGFWLWTVKDMDEAVDWVKRCPNPMPGPSEIEIRPMFESADLE
ncbi:MAG: YciI family protein [Dokdonella sp.]